MIVSLAGLLLVNSTTMRSMALGAILVVAVSVLAALTFLPAMMRVMGRRAYTRGRPAAVVAALGRSLRWRRRSRAAPGSERPGFWQRFTDRVTRRPVMAAVGSASVLLVLAVPALSPEIGEGALRQFPAKNETRVGTELAASRLGARIGRTDPGRCHLPRGRRLRRSQRGRPA